MKASVCIWGEMWKFSSNVKIWVWNNFLMIIWKLMRETIRNYGNIAERKLWRNFIEISDNIERFNGTWELTRWNFIELRWKKLENLKQFYFTSSAINFHCFVFPSNSNSHNRKLNIFPQYFICHPARLSIKPKNRNECAYIGKIFSFSWTPKHQQWWSMAHSAQQNGNSLIKMLCNRSNEE